MLTITQNIGCYSSIPINAVESFLRVAASLKRYEVFNLAHFDFLLFCFYYADWLIMSHIGHKPWQFVLSMMKHCAFYVQYISHLYNNH
jgi:hypothetical protein